MTLPQIRQDLQLLPAAHSSTGTRQWLIHDPVQQRYIVIGPSAYVLFAVWPRAITAADAIAAAWSEYGEVLSLRDVEAFSQFLHASSLTVLAPEGGWRFFAATAARAERGLAERLLHNYLFFRVPLFAPQRFLVATLPLVRGFGSRAWLWISGLLGMLGLYLVSREWTVFLANADALYNLDGALLLAIGMLLVKAVHELAHAYVAVHFGSRVPVIGVAFMLGMPMLYCDVTDAWRLTERRQRLLVDTAGIAAELSIACLATFAWAFLPSGGAKSLAFTLATASWLLSLGINLNPFMRFDGYHIAGDLVRIENLQSRAFAVGRWRLRELLFNLRHAPPERMLVRTLWALAVYAWGTWLYRLVLFTGIAIAVYALFFKLAGVVLFLIEILYFIIGPLWSELKVWAQMRTIIVQRRRSWITAAALMSLLALAALPWSTQVQVPAVVEAAAMASAFTPMPAMVLAVHTADGARVTQGQPLVTLSAADLAQDLVTARMKLAQLDVRLQRRTADDEDREASQILKQERASLLRRSSGLEAALQDLVVRAALSGTVVEMNPSLRPGRMLGRKEPLLLIRSDAALVVRGYLQERDLWRVSVGAAGRFMPDIAGLEPLQVELASIGFAAVASLDQPELASLFGGPIPAIADAQNRSVPASAQYPVMARVSGPVAPAYLAQVRRGVLIVDGHAESLLARFWRQALRVLVRESGT